MRILISNDDGVTAPGLAALHAALADYAECVVIAPDQDKSGASSSLTLDRPLHPQTLANGFISLNGTPTDCVHLGLNGLLPQTPDMVVSGINLGANLGDDVLYSGTVAAALEGRFLGNTSLAFSLLSRQPDNLPAAAYIARTALAGEVILLKGSSSLHLERILLQFDGRLRCWETSCGRTDSCRSCGLFERDYSEHRQLRKAMRRKKVWARILGKAKRRDTSS